jgi:hypothetical protein
MARPSESTTVSTETIAKIPIVMPSRERMVLSLFDMREWRAKETLSRMIRTQMTIALIPLAIIGKISVFLKNGPKQ